MLQAYLNKPLAISASVLSAVSLMVVMPHTVHAQMMESGSGMQTGVTGAQTNPGSSSGSGQVVPPSNTVEGAGMESDMNTEMNSTEMNSTEMNSTEMESESGMQTGVTGDQTNPGSSSGSGQVVPPSNTVEGAGMESDMNTEMNSTEMNSTEMNSTEMESESGMQTGVTGDQTNPGSSSGSGQVIPPSNTVEGAGMESDMNSGAGMRTTTPATAPTTTAPVTTPSTSPRALW